MRKSLYSKVLSIVFLLSLIPLSSSVQSCSKKPKYNTRKGGAKIKSSGNIGNRKHKNSHVWGR